MNRRRVLGVSAGFFTLGGCLTRNDISLASEHDEFDIESTSIEVLNRQRLKKKPKHQAEIFVEKPNKRVRIKGTIATHRPCLELSVVPIRNEMKDGKVTSNLDVDIDIKLPEGENCQSNLCELDYEATLVFNQFPATLDVFHIDRDQRDDRTYRVGPLTEKSFS